MITVFWSHFSSQDLLFNYAGFFFIPLTSRLVNDDSAGCRKLTALAIKSLLEKVQTFFLNSHDFQTQLV